MSRQAVAPAVPLSKPCGFVFLCNAKTENECLQRQLFGLPSNHQLMVSRITAGSFLFLFNTGSRKLSGVHLAASDGAVDLEPDAWGGKFPAQVRVVLADPDTSLSMDHVLQVLSTRKVTAGKLKSDQVGRMLEALNPPPCAELQSSPAEAPDGQRRMYCCASCGVVGKKNFSKKNFCKYQRLNQNGRCKLCMSTALQGNAETNTQHTSQQVQRGAYVSSVNRHSEAGQASLPTPRPKVVLKAGRVSLPAKVRMQGNRKMEQTNERLTLPDGRTIPASPDNRAHARQLWTDDNTSVSSKSPPNVLVGNSTGSSSDEDWAHEPSSRSSMHYGPKPPRASSPNLCRKIDTYHIPCKYSEMVHTQQSSRDAQPVLEVYTDGKLFQEHYHQALYMEEASRQKDLWRRVGNRGKQRAKLSRGDECQGQGNRRGRLFHMKWTGHAIEVGSDIHIQIGGPHGVVFVCPVWYSEESPGGDHQEYHVTIAASLAFQNKPPFEVQVMESRTTFRCQHRAIDDCKINLLSQTPHADADARQIFEGITLDESLNEMQQHAVRQMARGVSDASSTVMVLQGPPGTGKSTVVAEAVFQLLTDPFSEHYILACAPSNEAADQLAIKIIQKFTEAQQLESLNMLRLNGVQRDVHSLQAVLTEYCNYGQDSDSDDTGRFNLVDLAELKQKRLVVCTCLAASHIHSMTPVGSDGWFTHLFVDEAAQATEPETMVPMCCTTPNGASIWLVGDYEQLGPVVKSPAARQMRLQIPTIERLALYSTDSTGAPLVDTRRVISLNVTYRAHPDIMRLYNNTIYRSLVYNDTHQDKQCMMESWMDQKKKQEGRRCPVIFHHVEGHVEGHYVNMNEVVLVVDYLQTMLQDGDLNICSRDIAVITPYNAQKRALREAITDSILRTHLEDGRLSVDTVHKFQGDERKVVIISAVRSGCQGAVRKTLGMVADRKMANVMVSRAIAGLILIGNLHTLALSDTWQRLIDEAHWMQAIVGTSWFQASVSRVDRSSFSQLSQEFVAKWRHVDKPVPNIVSITKVSIHQSRGEQFKNYQAIVEQEMHGSAGSAGEGSQSDYIGNTRRRFHGTYRACSLGEGSQTQSCNSDKCSLCQILNSGFRLPKNEPDKTLRFGLGIYATATSSKADTYAGASDTKAVLVVDVVCGRTKKLVETWTAADTVRERPPDGYHSIVGEVANNLVEEQLITELDALSIQNPLNYDEVVVYDPHAIRPTYVVLYH